MGSVLVTGANGFVGREVINQLIARNYSILSVSREKLSPNRHVEQIQIRDVSEWSNWDDRLKNIDVIIHTAARVHVMTDGRADALDEYRRVNRYATLNLASQAAKAGVKRFIFLSTIKVNGELTFSTPFSAEDICEPIDPYGLSKWEAEQGLMRIADETAMEVVIIRPPLIYGPNVKGNFASMMNWVSKGWPLPFAAVKNSRSLLAMDNLVSFIISCLDHPKAANEVFLIADNESFSMPELIQKLSNVQGRTVRLIPIPVSWMKFIAMVLGKKDIANRLFGSLQIDSRKARELLDWSPDVSMDEQLKKMVDSASISSRHNQA